MTFEKALLLLKQGRRVKRKRWAKRFKPVYASNSREQLLHYWYVDSIGYINAMGVATSQIALCLEDLDADDWIEVI